MAAVPKSWNVAEPEDLLKTIDHYPTPIAKGWMGTTPVKIREGMHCYAAMPKNVAAVGMPNPRNWSVMAEDWKLPENWKKIGFHHDITRNSLILQEFPEILKI